MAFKTSSAVFALLCFAFGAQGFHPPAPLYSYSAHFGSTAPFYPARFNPVPAVPHRAHPIPAPVHAPTVKQAAPVVAEPAAPVAVAAAPVPAAAPAPVNHVTSSQFHAQDELGGFQYGYSNQNSNKQETRDAYGNVKGSYSYVDAHGIERRVTYIADDYGFRLVPEATNVLPVETPEVANARLAHFDAFRAPY